MSDSAKLVAFQTIARTLDVLTHEEARAVWQSLGILYRLGDDEPDREWLKGWDRRRARALAQASIESETAKRATASERRGSEP